MISLLVKITCNKWNKFCKRYRKCMYHSCFITRNRVEINRKINNNFISIEDIIFNWDTILKFPYIKVYLFSISTFVSKRSHNTRPKQTNWIFFFHTSFFDMFYVTLFRIYVKRYCTEIKHVKDKTLLVSGLYHFF